VSIQKYDLERFTGEFILNLPDLPGKIKISQVKVSTSKPSIIHPPQGNIGIFVPDKRLLKSNAQNDQFFLLSRAALNAYRNFGLGRGYRLGGGSPGGLGSGFGGRLGGRSLSRLGSWLGDWLGGRSGDNLGSDLGSELGSWLGSGLGGCPLSRLGSWLLGWLIHHFLLIKVILTKKCPGTFKLRGVSFSG
jgi:hypothetical protein